jgi:uncharacterized membrane protein SpoIIM required for sporulation
VYVARHRAEWQRLEVLVRQAHRPRRLTGAECDELVDLYQRTATHLSVIRTRSPDPGLVDALSGLVTRARSAVAGAHHSSWRSVARYFRVTFPAAVYDRRWWVLGTALGFFVIAVALGAWIVADPSVSGALLPPESVRSLCERDFADYYSSHPAGSFAAQVWTNNVWVSATAICFGALLGIPTLLAIADNAVNVGVNGGYMTSCGQAHQFYTLILPHGMLELTAVFIAGAAGLRMGWRVLAPGPRRRVEALAEEGRAAVGIAVGLILVLGVSGMLEAFITPSGLPPAARLAIGATVEALFLAWMWIWGRAAAQRGETGDLMAGDTSALAPIAA